MKHERYPYDIVCENTCVDCGVVFPVIENIFAEVRCPSCQGKWRASTSTERNEKNLEKR